MSPSPSTSTARPKHPAVNTHRAALAEKKLPNNHCSNKATLIQLFRQRKGIHNLSIIGLFTVDQSTSIFKQLKCLWALGTAAQHVSLALQPFLLLSSSSQTRRQRSQVGRRSLCQCRAGLVPPPQERRVTQAQPKSSHTLQPSPPRGLAPRLSSSNKPLQLGCSL